MPAFRISLATATLLSDNTWSVSFSSDTHHFNLVDIPLAGFVYISTQGGFPSDGSEVTFTDDGMVEYEGPPGVQLESMTDILPFIKAKEKKPEWCVALESRTPGKVPQMGVKLDGLISVTMDKELLVGCKKEIVPDARRLEMLAMMACVNIPDRYSATGEERKFPITISPSPDGNFLIVACSIVSSSSPADSVVVVPIKEETKAPSKTKEVLEKEDAALKQPTSTTQTCDLCALAFRLGQSRDYYLHASCHDYLTKLVPNKAS